MPSPFTLPLPFVVLADDLTGAAETAALGWRCGRRAVVLTAGIEPADTPELVVVDTDTRLDAAATAAQRVRSISGLRFVRAAGFVFKKTDSVLRGPVRAELEALAAGRGLTRVLLAPANPALGRIVQDGRYLIHGRPVHETAFARDPHHPVLSANVVAMLAPSGTLPVSAVARGARVPDRGIAVVDASTPDDLVSWADAVDARTLPAGAAGFLQALLAVRGWVRQPTPPGAAAQGPLLIISGTTVPAPPPDKEGVDTRQIVALPATLLSEPNRHVAWHADVEERLVRQGVVQLVTTGIDATTADVPLRIREAFTSLVTRLHRAGAFRHVVIEGGATASAIVRALGWNQLAIVHEWAQGVVTLRSAAAAGVLLTIKPGSYAWPVELWKLRRMP